MTESGKRIQDVMDYLNLNKNSFSVAIGMSSNVTIGRILNEDRNPHSSTLQKIVTRFPQVNYDWLKTGEGNMLKPETNSMQQEGTVLHGKLIPFYDAEAAAGTEYGMNMEPARQTGMIDIGTVLYDSESAIRVYGNSMIPNYPAGCVIGLKLHTDSFIEPGRVYVVETRDNRYLKRLYYTEDRSGFHCLSDNRLKFEDGPLKGLPRYQDFEIPLDEVIRLHCVVGVIKRNIL